jgi:hypothetical protein
MGRRNSGNHSGYQYNYRIPKGAEPKHAAVARLKSEGRLKVFRELQRDDRYGIEDDGRCLSRTKAFSAQTFPAIAA